MTSLDFYRQLTPFSDFLQFASAEVYQDVPGDWNVMISDVQGSTKAIEAGEYKTVNMIGASSIAEVFNTMRNLDLPFVFGGDGATILLPTEKLDEVKAALRSVQRQSQSVFGLHLRVGIVPVSEIQKARLPLRVGKYALGNDRCLAFFRGEGFDWAEKQVKGGKFILEPGPEAELSAVLEGLSCRWAPIAASRGHTLSILVKATSSSDSETLARIASQIDAIVDLSSPETHPVKVPRLEEEERSKAAIEVKLNGRDQTAKGRGWFGFTRFWTRVVRTFGMPVEGVVFNDYLNDIPAHSDFRKFDETLRMVIDCNDEMKSKVEGLLSKEYDAGHIYFGIHRSGGALMTCFVQNFAKGGHIHFVDGNDGGYTAAARGMKQQMRGALGRGPSLV